MIDVTGSLQIKNKIYQAVLSYKQDNKWKTKWVSTKIPAVKGNKKQAQAKLEEIRLQFQEEINSDNIEDEKILFIDYMKKWLKMIKASVEETTYNGYKGVVNGRLTDYFTGKNITLQDIKQKNIQEFYQYLLAEGLYGNTVKHYHANIRKALQYAMKTDIILSNPADKVDLPKIEEYKPKFYTSDEVKTLLNEVIGTKLEIPVMIDCFYGFRRSEVIGLKWSTVDFEKNTITINYTITQSNGKLIIRDKTKTKSSKRTLPLEPIVKSFLLELKEKQEKNKELCGNSYNQDYLEYICVDDGGNIIRPDYVTETFLKLLKKKKLKIIRFHDLRHTCASILLKNGANMKEIQAWLGHSNYNTTANLYAHLDTSSVNDVGKVITSVFSTKKEAVTA
jgi:integrase